MRKICFIGLVAFIVFGLISCSKDQQGKDSVTASENDLDANVTMAVASVASTQLNIESTEDIQSLTSTSVDSLSRILEREIWSGMGSHKPHHISSLDCATVTISDTVYPKTITIDYGDGCTSHGHTRKGKIVVEISDSLDKAGSIKTIKTVDYTIDSISIELSASVENLGQNSSGHWVIANSFTQVLDNIDGDVVSETMNDTIEWISGFETSSKSDNVYYKTGSGSINVNDTLTYSRTITSPLLYDRSCGYILSGILEVYKNDNTVVIDFGTGDCDKLATVTTDGVTDTINLSTYKFNDNSIFGKSHKRSHHKNHH